MSRSAFHHHTKSDQAIVTVRLLSRARKDLYLGGHGTVAHAEYTRVVGVRDANGGIDPGDTANLTVAEALVGHTKFIDGYYRE